MIKIYKKDIFAAYKDDTYSQKEIANYFGLHYSTVSKIIKKYEEEMV
ncbi:MAG: helix-turn-helix domain-containing protein [Proteobacteria bacterium]|nr:helix-turn-helix domain-containing protein [Pseudomonadota bacterium]NOG59419.1 helix-turn-helix domain-containing protein [Pseudomonadota bacterium]